MQQTLLVRELPCFERPRERLLKDGPAGLSLAELIAIIIRCGTKGENVIELSRRIVAEFGGADRLKSAGPSVFKKFKGVSDAKAAQLIAVFEIARRLDAGISEEVIHIGTSADAAKYLMPRMAGLKKEHLFGLYLDVRNRLIRTETISVGTLDSSLIHPREIFRPAVEEACASVIIAHNHPSGDPSPSGDDIEVTRRLIQAADVMSIEILDHLVIGKKKFVSMRDEGLM